MRRRVEYRPPWIGEDHAGAIVAFWDSPAHGSGSPNATDADPAVHADAFGSKTACGDRGRA